MEVEISRKIQNYYDEKLREHGPTAKGVDWKNFATQETRFELLSKLFGSSENFEVNDLGCGYGAFASYLRDINAPFKSYHGYDISPEMVRKGTELNKADSRCTFSLGGIPDTRQYTVSSGIFNVKLDIASDVWLGIVLELLLTMHRCSRDGFAYNMLGEPTDESFRRSHLFYADPEFFKEHCLKCFGRKVDILRHESLYEFTILVSDLK